MDPRGSMDRGISQGIDDRAVFVHIPLAGRREPGHNADESFWAEMPRRRDIEMVLADQSVPAWGASRLGRTVTAATALVVLVAVWAGGARAEPIDLMRASCADFASMNSNDQGQIALWLAGYYAGAAQRALLDIEKIAAAPAELLAICMKAPQTPLVGAETRGVFIPATP